MGLSFAISEPSKINSLLDHFKAIYGVPGSVSVGLSLGKGMSIQRATFLTPPSPPQQARGGGGQDPAPAVSSRAGELALPHPSIHGYHWEVCTSRSPTLGSLLTMDYQLGSPGCGARLVGGLTLVVSTVRGRDGGQKQRAFLQHCQARPATQGL